MPAAKLCLTAAAAFVCICPLSTAARGQTSDLRTQQFLAQHTSAQGAPAEALLRARTGHAAMLVHPRNVSLTAAWQPLGPSSVVSPAYGNITGRITAIALDLNDTTGNTVYLGTTGGGVWKSTNAAGPLASVTFAPLTDTLPVFSPSAGSSTMPSLSIGALAVQPAVNPVVLAGTGDPNNATSSLYGEGILRSSDNGLTWTVATTSHDGVAGNHSFAGLATAGIAWSTITPSQVVSAFTTSPQSEIVSAMNSYSVPGLYYSTDAGVTWQMSTVEDGASIVSQPISGSEPGVSATSVVWDAKRGRFFAAIRAHGYYASPDGTVWTRLANQPGAGLTLANCPTASASAACPLFRGTLAVQPVTGDLYAFTSDANNVTQGLWQDLCNVNSSGTCSNNAPMFSNRLDSGTLDTTNGINTLALNAAPAAGNSTSLFAGTTELYRCTLAAGATSCTFRNTTNANPGCPTPAGVAPAQHALASLTQANGTPLLFLGNDSGLWRSLDGVAETGTACNATDASHFDNLNAALGAGGSLAEIIGFAQHPTAGDTLLAGLGANGSAATSNASTLAAWPQLSTGEGGFPQLDPATPSNWYTQIATGVNLKQCALGSSCTAADFAAPATISSVQVENDTALLDPPTLLDPAATTNVLIGTCRVWRGPAASGALWSSANALSPSFNGTTGACGASSPLIRSIAAGGPSVITTDLQHTGSEVIYAGLAGLLNGGGTLAGHLFMTTSANTADSSSLARYWTDVSLNPVTNDAADAGIFNPQSFDISSISVDPHDPTGGTIYATIMGFGVPHMYRSVDFGSHWLNISANLPDAPANSIVVDPDDANTIYVALATGVYVTQAVTTCATTNCWSVLGTGLPNSPVTQLQAAAQIPTGDGREGMLRASMFGRGIWQTPLLSATSASAPGLIAAPATLAFAAQQVSTPSAAQTITLTSSGNAAVDIKSLAINGDFSETDNCAGQTLAIASTCSVSVVFTPTATGTRTGLLTVYANVPGGQVTVALSGIGTAPAAVTLTPSSLTFNATVVNQTSAPQIISVANTGSSSAALQTPVITGDFALSNNNCGASLAGQTACSVSITFTPIANGTRTGVFTITDSAGTQTAQLSGIGNAPATDTLSSTSLSFPQTAVGAGSITQQVTLTNAGDVPLTLITANVSAADFSVVNGCGSSLAARSTCALSVSFVPTATGTLTATLTVSDQFRSQAVTLSGTAVAPPGVSLTPASLTFAATGVSLSAPAQTLTLTNNGGLPLTFTSQTISPDFSLASNTCGTSLAVSSACTLTVVFTPSAAGARSGTLVLNDNAPTRSQTVNLYGTGVDFSLAANGSTSVTVASGQTATFPLLLNSLPGLSGNVAFACTGAPAHSLCTVVPETTTLGSAVNITATVQTGLSTALLERTLPWHTRRLALYACAFPFFLMRRMRRRAAVLALLALFIPFSISGCGAARLIPSSGNTGAPVTPTPSGSYTLAVTATAAGLSHSIPLTLTVQ